MSTIPSPFSNNNRTQRIQKAIDTPWDLLIIGGGITGAGIALDASLRGMKVLLIEKGDFASGTSSKSTKLIHGGLRYLKQLEFGLVRETGMERAVAHDNICHLVHPKNMVLPIVHNGTFSALSANLAISVYDRLAKVKEEHRRRRMSKSEMEDLEPLLKKELIKSGIVYSEYRTDDARLTIELIKAAIRNGAEAFNYLEAKSFLYKKKKITGVICHDVESGKELNLSAKTVINSCGPWADDLRRSDDAGAESNLQLSKGVHLVLDKKVFNLKNAVYFDAFDGRMIFAIPRGKSVYVGTTDTFYHDDKDDLRCTEEDARYLIKALQGMFNISSLELNDIKSSWSGLRPLIKKKGKGASELSRKDEIFVSESGLITIAGGKLTGFRKMAERVLDLATEKSRFKDKKCGTKNYKIHHNPFVDYPAYLNALGKIQVEYQNVGVADLEQLLSSFGNDAFLIINDASTTYGGDLIKSQVYYTINYESVLLPMDFLERRTGWLYFDIDQATAQLEAIIGHFATALHHDEKWVQNQVIICQKAIDQASLAKLKSASKQAS